MDGELIIAAIPVAAMFWYWLALPVLDRFAQRGNRMAGFIVGLFTSKEYTESLPNGHSTTKTGVPDTQVIPTMRERAWLSLLNDKPQQIPHLRINGATGTGKTTFVTALLTRRTGHICIVTPKHRDKWGSLPFITLDTDSTDIHDRFGSIKTTIAALIYETGERLSERTSNTPLTIVLDDYPVLVSYAPQVKELLELVTLIGRSEGVRLIILAQSNRVELLGLKGKGDLMEGFVTVNLERNHVASLDYDSQRYMLQTRNVQRLSQQRLALSPWYAPTTPLESHTEPLEDTMTTTTTTDHEGAENGTQQPVVVGVEGVTSVEQIKIITAALEVRQEQGRINRSEVCRRVFDGKTGGIHYQKVKSVCDHIESEEVQ